MRTAPLLLALAISTALPLAAQQPRISPPSGCPIVFGAQMNGRAIARTIEDQKKYGSAPQLQLTFRAGDVQKILGATLVVHGLPSSSRYLSRRIKVRAGTPPQTFDLGGDAGLSEAEMVWLTKVLFVDWAELTELRYAIRFNMASLGARPVPRRTQQTCYLLPATAHP